MKVRAGMQVAVLVGLVTACPTRAAPDPVQAPRRVFNAVKAGSWYPGTRDDLDGMLQGFLDAAKPEVPAGQVVALISPHAGYTWSGATAAHGYKLLQGRSVTRVIVLGPSHTSGFAGFSVLDATHYHTPLGDVAIDAAATRILRQHVWHRDETQAWQREHSLEMQIPFLQKVLAPGFAIVPVMIGAGSTGDQLQSLARALQPLVNAQTLVVASSDFTHYGANFDYFPFRDEVERRLKDELAMPAFEAIRSGDPARFALHLQKTHDTICGHDPITVLMELQPQATPQLLKYDTSGRQTGDFSSSVSYQSIAYVASAGPAVEAPVRPPAPRFQPAPSGLDETDKKLLIQVARASLTDHLRGSSTLETLRASLSPSAKLRWVRGAFVTINKKKQPGADHAELRGCIGHMMGQGPLLDEIAALAIQSGTQDPRFPPMSAAELDEVLFEISILSPMQDVNSWRDIVLGLHGMTVAKDGRRAVFLPQVAPEWGWTLEQTLTQLSKKAGLAGDAWREGARFQVFTADVFDEESPPRR
ncbi:MAG: AmmeMemoRadiSam system protein B [Pseudomonadota bacterium]